jgi:hypothetical protein
VILQFNIASDFSVVQKLVVIVSTRSPRMSPWPGFFSLQQSFMP